MSSSSARQTTSRNDDNTNAHKQHQRNLEEKEEKYLFVNGESIAHNAQINTKTFTSLSILSGSIAGILGATDWIGFVWYCATILVVGGVTVVFRCKNEPKRFAMRSRSEARYSDKGSAAGSRVLSCFGRCFITCAICFKSVYVLRCSGTV